MGTTPISAIFGAVIALEERSSEHVLNLFFGTRLFHEKK
jgi:hypothetical protein